MFFFFFGWGVGGGGGVGVGFAFFRGREGGSRFPWVFLRETGIFPPRRTCVSSILAEKSSSFSLSRRSRSSARC